MLKRIVSVLMALSMIMSVFAVSITSASAADSPQITGVTGYAESEDPTRVMGDAVDGNTDTFWHTKFNSDDVIFAENKNNSYYLDLGAEYVVDKFEYVPKQKTDKNGKITDFILYGTTDTDRETAQWTEIANVTGWTYGTSGEGMESHFIDISDPQPWRMLKITVSGAARNDTETHDFICAAEFRVYGNEYQAEIPVWEYEPEGADSARIVKYNGTDTNVVIPETIDGRTVSSIGAMNTSTSVFKEAFDNGVKIESVVMPDTVVLINQCAFKDIASLKSITLSQNITEIRTNAFLNCASLEKIDIPDTVDEIGNNAFIGCEALKTIIIRGKNTYINKAGASAYTAAFGFMEISQKTKIEGITMVGVAGSKAQEYTKTYSHIAFMTIDEYEFDAIIYMDSSKLNISYNAETGYGSEPWSYFAVDADGNDVELTVDKSDSDLSDGTSKSNSASSTYRVGKYGFNTNPDSTGYTEIGYRFTTPYEGILSMTFTRDIFGSNNANAAEIYIKYAGSTIVSQTWETSDRAATAEDKAINSKWNYIYEKGDFQLNYTSVTKDQELTLTGKMGGSYNKNMWITPVVTYERLSSKSMLQYYQDVYLDSLDLSEAKRAKIDEYIAALPAADEIRYDEAQEAVLAIDEIIAEEEGILGDANGDGIVDINDVTCIQYYLANINVPSFYEEFADVNQDGKITIIDATLIQIMIAKGSV